MKAWPHDWAVFLTPMSYNKAEKCPVSGKPKLIGTFSKRPEYAEIEDLLTRQSFRSTNLWSYHSMPRLTFDLIE